MMPLPDGKARNDGIKKTARIGRNKKKTKNTRHCERSVESPITKKKMRRAAFQAAVARQGKNNRHSEPKAKNL